MRLTAVWALCLAVVPISWNAFGQQTRWISDQLPLDMRSGNSNAYRVIKMLAPGTPITVIQVDTKAEFSEVVTKQGTKGWIANRYLMNEPSVRSQLAEAEAELARLNSANEPLNKEISELKTNSEQLNAELEATTSRKAELEQELEYIRGVSANAVALDQNNQTLIQKNQLLQHEIGILKGENGRLADSARREWFLNGALAVGLGAMLAVVIPRVTPKRKHNEWR